MDNQHHRVTQLIEDFNRREHERQDQRVHKDDQRLMEFSSQINRILFDYRIRLGPIRRERQRLDSELETAKRKVAELVQLIDAVEQVEAHVGAGRDAEMQRIVDEYKECNRRVLQERGGDDICEWISFGQDLVHECKSQIETSPTIEQTLEASEEWWEKDGFECKIQKTETPSTANRTALEEWWEKDG